MLAPTNSLSLRDAAAKYDIPPKTLSNWAKSGLVKRATGPGGKPLPTPLRGQPLLLDEESVKLASENYRPGRGHWNTRDIREAMSA